ncbi:MAG: LysR family transcriptional regulator [Pseudomonadota bacterium]
MDWDDVRFFLALHRHGTVSAAGKALNVNHTTVSRRLSALEKQLRTRLFDRTPEGYQLTQVGEDMLELATQMESTANAIDRKAAGRDADLQGPLVVTMPYDVANHIVMPGFEAFLSAYPGIDVQFKTTRTLVDLSARDADLAIRLTDTPPDHLVGRKLLPLRHGVYAHPDYWQAHAHDPSVILFPGEATPDWVSTHFPTARVAMRTDNISTMLAAVEAGIGIARMACFVADSNPVVGRVDVELMPSNWGVWSLNHVDLRSTARVRVCRDFLQQQILGARALIMGEASRSLRALAD